MKFIHTSDWHIGRQFHSVSLLDDQRHVLDQIVAHIKNEAVDAVIIAGDIYDRSVPPAADRLLGRLRSFGQLHRHGDKHACHVGRPRPGFQA